MGLVKHRRSGVACVSQLALSLASGCTCRQYGRYGLLINVMSGDEEGRVTSPRTRTST